jgi:DNA-binding MarR family transcriptional regulator
MKERTNAVVGIEKTRNAMVVHNRIANAVLDEKKRMENEGMVVPSVTVSVKGDDRLLWKPEKYFNKTFKSYIELIRKKYGLSVNELGIIYLLSQCITYESNLIVNTSGDPMIKKDLEEILGIGQNAVDKHMATLIKKGVFSSVKIKRSVNYYLDPRIAYQGNRIDFTLLTMFHIDTKSLK